MYQRPDHQNPGQGQEPSHAWRWLYMHGIGRYGLPASPWVFASAQTAEALLSWSVRSEADGGHLRLGTL